MYVDDKLQVSDWNDGVLRSHPDFPVDNVAGSVHRFKVEYYHTSGNADFQIYMTPPGGTETNMISQYTSPDYSLSSNRMF